MEKIPELRRKISDRYTRIFRIVGKQAVLYSVQHLYQTQKNKAGKRRYNLNSDEDTIERGRVKRQEKERKNKFKKKEIKINMR